MFPYEETYEGDWYKGWMQGHGVLTQRLEKHKGNLYFWMSKLRSCRQYWLAQGWLCCMRRTKRIVNGKPDAKIK